MGSTHSASGLVTDSVDHENESAVTLFKYVPPAPFNAITLYQGTDGKHYVRVPAGRSYLDMYQVIRPAGYFLGNQTAGSFFSIGGTVAAPVHGGVYGADMLNRYAVEMQVVTFGADGKAVTKIITDESELRDWRCGFGLMGIITGVTFGPLVERTETTIIEIKPADPLPAWGRTAFDAIVTQSKADNNYAEFFLDCHPHHGDSDPENPPMRIYQVAWPKTGGTATPPLLAKAWYAFFNSMNKWKDSPLLGDPTIAIINDGLKAIGPLANTKEVASGMIGVSAFGYGLYTAETRATTNDGYWVKGAPCASIMAFYIPATYTFDFLEAYRTVFLERWGGHNIKLQYRINQMSEFRYVTVQADGPTLYNLTPGEYCVVEALTLNGYSQNQVNAAYADIEAAWKVVPYDPARPLATAQLEVVGQNTYVRAYPHVAKQFAFKRNPAIVGPEMPFQRSLFSLESYGLVTASSLAEFKARRNAIDPTGVFLAPQSSWLLDSA